MYWKFQKMVKTNIICEIFQQCFWTFLNNEKHIKCCFKLCYKMCTLQCCKCNITQYASNTKGTKINLLMLNVNQIWTPFKRHHMSCINHHHTYPPSFQLIHYTYIYYHFLTLICTYNKKIGVLVWVEYLKLFLKITSIDLGWCFISFFWYWSNLDSH